MLILSAHVLVVSNIWNMCSHVILIQTMCEHAFLACVFHMFDMCFWDYLKSPWVYMESTCLYIEFSYEYWLNFQNSIGFSRFFSYFNNLAYLLEQRTLVWNSTCEHIVVMWTHVPKHMIFHMCSHVIFHGFVRKGRRIVLINIYKYIKHLSSLCMIKWTIIKQLSTNGT